MQKAVQQFKSTCGQASIYVENEMPIGLFHDFLMQIKGMMVERMVQAQKEQESQAKAAMELPPHESEVSASSECNKESNPCNEGNCNVS